jgi:hypothetical protein
MSSIDKTVEQLRTELVLKEAQLQHARQQVAECEQQLLVAQASQQALSLAH